jgi:hypothetical protein
MAGRELNRHDVVHGGIGYVLTHAPVELGFVVGVIPWLVRLNGVVDAWTRAKHGRRLATSIRWSLVWRAGLVSFPILFGGGILMTLAEDMIGGYPRILRVVELVMFVVVLIAVMIGVGWAMLTVVAKQIHRSALPGSS